MPGSYKILKFAILSDCMFLPCYVHVLEWIHSVVVGSSPVTVTCDFVLNVRIFKCSSGKAVKMLKYRWIYISFVKGDRIRGKTIIRISAI